MYVKDVSYSANYIKLFLRQADTANIVKCENRRLKQHQKGIIEAEINHNSPSHDLVHVTHQSTCLEGMICVLWVQQS